MKKYIILFILSNIFLSLSIKADEGMWIPLFLKKYNEKDMQNKGLKITAEDIYSINNSSLKDAIVLFGGGCTGEIISKNGLLLTNHHCGYSRIQAHSSVEKDYLTDGFWAKNSKEELSNPGLTVTFLNKIEDVTTLVLDGVSDKMTEKERNSIIEINKKKIEKEATNETNFKAEVESFYYGNQYLLFVTQEYKDIRLVGAPPSSIGKFGGDTDNWMWPRHTGDFAVFRIYADKNNNPADYSEENIPYKPKKSLKISLKGVKEGDFTFVYGYPGKTEEYLPSYDLKQTIYDRNPAVIDIRRKRLDIFEKYMNIDKKTRIQYASKHASISNSWKKWIGESKGLISYNAVEKKQLFEAEFIKWTQSNIEAAKYKDLLNEYEKVYKKITPLYMWQEYFFETIWSIEMLRYSTKFVGILNKTDLKEDELKSNLKNSYNAFLKDYSKNIDKEVFAELLKTFIININDSLKPEVIKEIETKYGKNINEYVDKVFEKSIITNDKKLNKFIDNYNSKKAKGLQKDMAVNLIFNSYMYYQNNIMNKYTYLSTKLDSLNRVYMKAQMEMQKNKTFYPDANLTLRIAYGNVLKYEPKDGVEYDYYTTLDGIIEKDNPEIYDYNVPNKLKELVRTKEYGIYAKDGKLPVCFIASNHTTGGNSGSPVLNAQGDLIGINFDRCWEGTMSDLMYNIDKCRNIALDIRYCLFVIDKYANAGYLIEEMDIDLLEQ